MANDEEIMIRGDGKHAAAKESGEITRILTI